MTLSGWIILIISWTAIIALAAFCFGKIFACHRRNIHAPLDIDTEDHDTMMP